MYILFSIMLKENQKKEISLNEVMPIVEKLNRSVWGADPQETCNTVQEMFELLMLSDFADTKELRERAFDAVTQLRELVGPLNELNDKTGHYA